MTLEELIVNLLKEGVDVPTLSKASEIPETELYALGIVDESEALPEAAVQLAWLGIKKGEEILRTGSQTNQLRLVSVIFNHVMRAYRGETPKAFQNLQEYIAGILRGEDLELQEEP